MSSGLGNLAYAGRGIPETTYLVVNDPISMWTEQLSWTLTYPFIWAVNDWSGQTPPPWYPAFQPPEIPSGPCK